MRIKNLSDKEIEDLKSILKEDGFTKISVKSNYISFSKEIRSFKQDKKI